MKGILIQMDSIWAVTNLPIDRETDNSSVAFHLPVLQETFDINSPTTPIELVEGKEVDFEIVEGPYAKLI